MNEQQIVGKINGNGRVKSRKFATPEVCTLILIMNLK